MRINCLNCLERPMCASRNDVAVSAPFMLKNTCNESSNSSLMRLEDLAPGLTIEALYTDMLMH